MKENVKNLKNENVTKDELKEVELQPSWSKLKSFHGKAIVGTKENGDKYLKSFGFLVCEIIKGQVKIHNEVDKWDSKSTIRHINNFLFENRLETGNTKELIDLYITKTKKAEKVEDKEEPKQTNDEKLKNKKNENPKKVDEPKENTQKQETTINTKSKIKKIENFKNENQEKLVEAGA